MLSYLPPNPEISPTGQVLGEKPLEFWLPTLELLRRRHKLPDGQWQRFKSGRNAVFSLDDKFVLKLTPPFWRDDALHEVAALRCIKPQIRLDCPEVLASDELDSWQILITNFLPGRILSTLWKTLPLSAQTTLAGQIGQIAATIHTVKVDTNYQKALSFDWLSLLNSQLTDFRLELAQSDAPAHLQTTFESFVTKTKWQNTLETASVLLHGDLSAVNFIVEEHPNQWRITGLLDFGDSSVGAPLHDFLSPNFNTFQAKADLLTAFYDGYKLPSGSRTLEFQNQLMLRTLLWYSWADVKRRLPPEHTTSWEKIASDFWHLR
jgi:hygromycin-B 7''-O-kinase